MSEDQASDDRNGGAKADTRDKRGRFAAGNPGRPPGTRHRITRAVEALLEGEAEELTRRAIDQALAGDTVALRLCLERLLPPMRGRTVHVALPAIKTASDGLAALDVVLEAVAEGSITPEEGGAVASLVAEHRKQLEATEFEQRLRRLEELSERK
jgi:hypothetical protein